MFYRIPVPSKRLYKLLDSVKSLCQIGDDVVGMLSAEIQGAALRLARLLDAPADIPVLAPIFERELLYRLLTSALSGHN